ncbi:MAG TPA: alpha/beta hydrolase [Hanamia sp.]
MLSAYYKKFFFTRNLNSLFIIFILIMMHHISSAQTTIPLYRDVPNSKPATDYKEQSETGDDGIIRISKVTVPEITIFQPAKSGGKNTAIIICPGGGYGILAYNLEGIVVANILNSWGVTGIVLKYRLPGDKIMKDKSVGPIEDAQRAIQYVREKAAQLNINPDKIGIMGFSAGGHLASTVSTHFDKDYISNPNHISLRPDFSILAYPVISMIDSLTHKGSRDNLLGKNPSDEITKNFSNELQVTKNTPPTFIVLAGDDNTVNPENSIKYYEALLKNHVPAEMHIYQNGGHGFGTRILEKNDNWTEVLRIWMTHNGFIN